MTLKIFIAYLNEGVKVLYKVAYNLLNLLVFLKFKPFFLFHIFKQSNFNWTNDKPLQEFIKKKTYSFTETEKKQFLDVIFYYSYNIKTIFIMDR